MADFQHIGQAISIIRKDIALVIDSWPVNFTALICIILLLVGFPVPYVNEYVYLLYPQRFWNTDFFINDFTFLNVNTDYFLFNLIVGAFTTLVDIEVLAWTGRIFSWALTIGALLRLGQNFKIRLWMVNLGILIWFLSYGGESIVGQEWVFGGFEAKTIAYPLLLISIERFLRKKFVLGAVFLGLSAAFHPVIGFWGTVGVCFGILGVGHNLKMMVKILSITAVSAAPALITMLPELLSQYSTGNEVKRFLVLTNFPFHFDSNHFSKSGLLTLSLMFVFNSIYFLEFRKDKITKFIYFFQVGLCMFFVIGVVCRWLELYSILLLFPFRLFPLLVPLFFFWNLMALWDKDIKSKMVKKLIALLAVITLLCIPNTLSTAKKMLDKNSYLWNKGYDEYEYALKWISENTPKGAICISPPWRIETFYYSKRAQIVNLNAIPNDRLDEWFLRVKTLIGHIDEKDSSNKYKQMEKHFSNLTEYDIMDIKRSFGGDFLVTTSRYNFPLMYENRLYKIYCIKAISESWLSGINR